MDADTPTNDPARRRVIIRRTRGGGGGFSPSVSTRSESLRSSDESTENDEVDEAIEPTPRNDAARLNSEIRGGRTNPVRPPQGAAPTPPDRENPHARMNQVALAGSASYAKEYRLTLLHRMLMRNVPLDQIAQQLQVSISTVQKDRVELKKRLREAATEMNINEMVGSQNGVYDEIAGMAMRIASSGQSRDENGNITTAVPTAMRLAALRTVLATQADRTRFLNTAGVFDVLRFRRQEDGSALSDVQQLMMKTQEMMEAMLADGGENIPTPPAPRAGTFNTLSFDDIDASGSGNEIQEI